MEYKNFQFTMIIKFYVFFLGGRVHKSSIHDINLKFMQPTLEDRFKNFEFPMIIDFYAQYMIDFYAIRLRKKVQN